jgi:hypothetical protein
MGTKGYEPKGYLADIGATILARDWKGPTNFTEMNGVIEL